MSDGANLALYGGIYDSSNVSRYIASGYTLKNVGGKWQVVRRDNTPDSVVAVVNGNEYYEETEVSSFLESSSATVKLYKDFTAGLTFQKGGTLDLNGKTLTGDIVNRGTSLYIQDSGGTGTVTGKVTNPGGGVVTIIGGGFGSEPNASFIPSQYRWDSATSRVRPVEAVSTVRIGSVYYPTLDDALEAARTGDRLVLIERTDLSGAAGDYTVTDPIEKNISLQLGSNGIKSMTVDGANVMIYDGFVRKLTVQNDAAVTVSGTRFINMPTLNDGGTIFSNVALTPLGVTRYIINAAIKCP